MVTNNLKQQFKSKLYEYLFIIKLKRAPKMSKAILTEIKKRIEEEKKENPQFQELNLSQIVFQKFTPQIAALIEKQKSVEVLHLVSCGLKTLEGFPKGKWVAIDFSKNELDDNSHFEVLTNSADLSQLIFSENKVAQLDTVLKLKSLSKLVQIDFEGNPVASNPDYSKTVFDNFSNMEYVDRKDKEGNYQPEEEQAQDDFDDDEEDDYEGEDDEDEEFDEDNQNFSDESESEKPKKSSKKKR